MNLQLYYVKVSELLFQRYGYLKKLIEEANSADDTRILLQFCCWENPTFSHAVLYELLWQVRKLVDIVHSTQIAQD